MGASLPGSNDRQLRILMTADAVGGVWQYAADLISGLVEQGAEVLLATMGPRPSAAQKHQLSSPGVNLVETEYALEWMPDAWGDVDAAGAWLLELANSFHPDVIHLNGYAHAKLPWGRPVIVVAHSCVYSWWRAVHGCAASSDWGEYKQCVTEGLSCCNVVIAPSAYMASAIQLEYGVPHEKLHVIHNFIRTNAVDRPKETAILAAGRLWDKAKNLSLLDCISSRLHWQLRIAGSALGPSDSAAPVTAAKLLGCLSHSELMEEMALAAIFAHPALYEPFGLSVLEAAHSRCCLVLSDIPSLRELWDGAAIFINPRDPEQWVYELNSLSHDSNKRSAYGTAAFSRASEYRAEMALSAYWNVYRALARVQVSGKEVAA